MALIFFKFYLFNFGYRLSLVAASGDNCSLGGHLLIVLACLVIEHGLQVHGHQQVQHAGSVVAHGFSCSKACGIFLNQGWNPCLLHWQVDSATKEVLDLFLSRMLN